MGPTLNILLLCMLRVLTLNDDGLAMRVLLLQSQHVLETKGKMSF